MQSKLINLLQLDNYAVAVIHTNDKPAGALEFEAGKWACVVSMFAAAARGNVAVFSRETHGCSSGGVGLCLKDEIAEPPGSLAKFLSTGAGPGFREGEYYIKTPELAQDFIDNLPRFSIPEKYVVLKPLADVDEAIEQPVLVVIFTGADQLAALHFMANYARKGGEAVYMPWGAGCHTVNLFPYQETLREQPRAVIGCTDMTARPYLDERHLSFAIPWALFLEMENNIEGSFMERGDWPKLLKKRGS